MTEPTQMFRRQGQAHKSKGAGNQAAYDGAYTSELYAIVTVTGAATDTAVVAAVAAKRIRVLSYSVSCVAAGASTIVFNSKPGGAGTAITHTISLAANGNSSESDNNGLFQTAVGEGLSASAGANNVGIRVTYILVE